MNRHEIADKFAVSAGALYGEKMKFFNKNIEAVTLAETIKGIEIPESPEIHIDESAVGKGQSLRMKFEDLDVKPEFTVIKMDKKCSRTLIFHHGSGDQPYFKRINTILKSSADVPGFNIIATGSPYNTSMKEYMSAVGDLQKFELILAAPVVLIEALTAKLKADGQSNVTVSGISLGGWITNLHHTYFNSAHEYRPVFAGAALDELFISSAYRSLASKMTYGKEAQLTRALNFEADFSKRDNSNVYPLLGRYDQYIEAERQKGIYKPENIIFLEKGHVTGTIDGRSLKEHIFTGIQTLTEHK